MKFEPNFVKITGIVTLLIAVALSCNYPSPRQEPIFKTELPDTSRYHQLNLNYEIVKNTVQPLNLTSLENGTESFELRFWSHHFEVLVIKKIEGDWTALYYWYHTKYKPTENGHPLFKYWTSITIDTFSVKKVQPKSGWAAFYSKTLQLKILDLPDQDDIPGFRDVVSDGYSYSIEFANANRYKFYSYHCPGYYQDKFEECRLMTKIIELFFEEFGLYSLYDPTCGELRKVSK